MLKFIYNRTFLQTPVPSLLPLKKKIRQVILITILSLIIRINFKMISYHVPVNFTWIQNAEMSVDMKNCGIQITVSTSLFYPY